MTGPSTVPDPVSPGDEPSLAPASSARTRRVVLGLAVALLVLVGGGGAVLAMSTGAGRDGDDPRAAGGSGSGADPEASSVASGAPPLAGAPSSSAGVPASPESTSPLPAPPDDAFRSVPGLCEDADFSPVFDVLARAETLGDEELADPAFYQRECTFRLADPGSTGTFQVNVSIYSGPDEAQGWFDDILTAEARGEPSQELAGDWDANAVLTAVGPDQADVRFLARDETLLLNLRAFVVGDAADEQAQQAAVVEVAAQLRDAIRA